MITNTPTIFIESPDKLELIKSQITQPPDIGVIPWAVLPYIDQEAVQRRQRLEKAAQLRKEEEQKKAEQAKLRPNASAFAPSDTGSGKVDFSSAKSTGFFRNIEGLKKTTGSEERKPAEEKEEKSGYDFGSAFGSKAKATETKRRHNQDSSDILSRLRTNFMSGDK